MNKRLFVGIPVKEPIKQAATLLHTQHKNLEAVRWTPIAQLHLTTWFIGEIPELMVHNIKSIIQIILRRQKKISIEFSHLYLAPNPRNPRMIWAKYKLNDAFQELIQKHNELFGNLGIYEKRFAKIIPHITLARFKENSVYKDDFRLTQHLFPKYLLIDRLTLWESLLSSSGAKYIELKSFLFRS